MREATPPLPQCTSFLTVRRVTHDPKTKEAVLVGLPTSIRLTHFPASRPIWACARFTGGHGSYRVEVQLQSVDGDMTSKEGPPNPLAMDDPLRFYDVNIQLHAIYPKPGRYFFVLLLDGKEVARQAFQAAVVAVPTK